MNLRNGAFSGAGKVLVSGILAFATISAFGQVSPDEIQNPRAKAFITCASKCPTSRPRSTALPRWA